METYTEKYTDGKGNELEMTLKAECSSEDELREMLRFVATSSRNFYIQKGSEVKSKL